MKLTSSPLVRALIVTGIVFVLGVASDLWLGREGISRLDLMLLGDGLAAAAVGALFLVHTARVQEQQRQLERKLRVVAEMNHHIRNALQPLLYLSSLMPEEAAEQGAMMRDSVKRIEWALHEILPDDEDKKNTAIALAPRAAGDPQKPLDGSVPGSVASDRINKIHAPE